MVAELESFVNCYRLNSHIRHNETRQFRRVGLSGVN